MNLAEPKITYGGQEGIDNFLKGFSLMASVSAKRRAAENQIAAMQLREQMAEWKHGVDQENLVQADRKIGDMERFHQEDNVLKDLKYERVLREGAIQNQEKQQDERNKTDLAQKIASIDADKGTTEWQRKFDEIQADKSWLIANDKEAKLFVDTNQNGMITLAGKPTAFGADK